MSNKNLYHLMSAKGINQTRLAKETGVPQPTISRIIRGDTTSPRFSSIKKIANYFDVPLEDVIGSVQ